MVSIETRVFVPFDDRDIVTDRDAIEKESKNVADAEIFEFGYYSSDPNTYCTLIMFPDGMNENDKSDVE